MPREANAVDFWRGFALVSIFVNHVPGIYYERFTHRNLSFSDSAELFVFLAGWSLGLLVYGNSFRKGGTSALTFRLGGRSLQIYTAHIVISALALAMLAGAAYLMDIPPIQEWHNAAAFFHDPTRTQIGIVLLTHQLGYFDILPLYVVLMLIAPTFVIIDRFAPHRLVPLSLALYFAALIVPFTAPTWPVEGQWFFNPFTWQVLFAIGAVCGRRALLEGRVLPRGKWVTVLAAVVVLAGLWIRLGWRGWLPELLVLPVPMNDVVFGKQDLALPRILHALAFAVLAARLTAREGLLARPVFAPLRAAGRHSLEVFCVGLFLSWAGSVALRFGQGAFWIDAIAIVAGIATLLCFAVWKERGVVAALSAQRVRS